MFNFFQCAWECRTLQANTNNSSQKRSATPVTYQATSTASKEGSKGGSKRSPCQYDPMLHPMQQCPVGYAAVWNGMACSWDCKYMASQQSATAPQTRVATPTTYQATPTASKGGSKGGSKGHLCQYDPALHPMQPCPVGKAAVWNGMACAWDCKDMSMSSAQQSVTGPQKRYANHQIPQTYPISRSEDSMGTPCQYNAALHPMQPCPAGYYAAWNGMVCSWGCKGMSSQSQTRAATLQAAPKREAAENAQPVECPSHHISFYSKRSGKNVCIAVPDMGCPDGQHITFDDEKDSFNCHA